MALRVPILNLPANANFGGANVMAGTASMIDAEVMALTQLVTAGTSFDTDPVLVAGYNSFSVLTTFTGTGTLTLSYTVRDPRDFTIQFTRQVAAGLATGSFQVFGAFAAVGPADPFLVIGLRFGAVTNNITITGVKFNLASR
jgi:hypothetical protein